MLAPEIVIGITESRVLLLVPILLKSLAHQVSLHIGTVKLFETQWFSR